MKRHEIGATKGILKFLTWIYKESWFQDFIELGPYLEQLRKTLITLSDLTIWDVLLDIKSEYNWFGKLQSCTLSWRWALSISKSKSFSRPFTWRRWFSWTFTSTYTFSWPLPLDKCEKRKYAWRLSSYIGRFTWKCWCYCFIIISKTLFMASCWSFLYSYHRYNDNCISISTFQVFRWVLNFL